MALFTGAVALFIGAMALFAEGLGLYGGRGRFIAERAVLSSGGLKTAFYSFRGFLPGEPRRGG
jgi:hypothetical protein